MYTCHDQMTKRVGQTMDTAFATFEFEDGKIIKHTDDFDLWKWTKQALGFLGYLLGWSSFMKNKIQSKTTILLSNYIKRQ